APREIVKSLVLTLRVRVERHLLTRVPVAALSRWRSGRRLRWRPQSGKDRDESKQTHRSAWRRSGALFEPLGPDVTHAPQYKPSVGAERTGGNEVSCETQIDIKADAWISHRQFIVRAHQQRNADLAGVLLSPLSADERFR